MHILNKYYSHDSTKKPLKLRHQQTGFTIVELMIALTVLSIILVLSSAIFIEIGSLYSKGVNGATLQNTTRNIVADVSATMQFSSAPPPSCTLTTPPPPPSLPSLSPPAVCSLATSSNPNTTKITGYPVYAYCIGTTRYTFVLGRELGTDQGANPTEHVLWRDTISSPGSCVPLDLTNATPSDGYTVSGSGYEMMAPHMRLTKFIVEPAPTSDNIYNIDVSTAFGDTDLLNSTQTNCNGGEGQQYCATSQINTTLIRRAPSQ